MILSKIASVTSLCALCCSTSLLTLSRHSVTDGGKNIQRAQYIFGVVYLLLEAVVLAIYYKTKVVDLFSPQRVPDSLLSSPPPLYLYLRFFSLLYISQVPPWVLPLLGISKRIHSIFVLRLFNDCFSMLFLYLSVLLFCLGRWSLGCLLFR